MGGEEGDDGGRRRRENRNIEIRGVERGRDGE
jgi:hypothetical protein